MAQLPAPSKSDSLALRVLSSVVLLPLVLAAIWLGGLSYIVLLAMTAAVAGYEWAGLMDKEGTLQDHLRPPMVTAAVVIVGGFVTLGSGLILAVLGALLVVVAAKRRTTAEPLINGTGVLYIGLALMALLVLREGVANGLLWTVYLCAVVWATDIGAYAVGRTIGGPRLAPVISPGKTWSGLGGGVLAALAAGYAVAHVGGHQSPALLGGLAVLLALTAQGGDLLESLMKRRSGAADSGTLIPGHGGVLDRIDGLMPAAMLLGAVVVGSGADGGAVLRW